MAKSPELIVSDDRLSRLLGCELKIFTACRRGLEATCEIAESLIEIEDDKLYLEKEDAFDVYVEKDLRLDYRNASRFMDILRTMRRLQEEKVHELPANESQAWELTRLPMDSRAHVWETLLETCKENNAPVTVGAVRDAVDIWTTEEKKAGRPTKPRRKPVAKILDMDLDDESPNGEEQPKAPDRIILSEDGERALDRIRRLCGDAVAKAIEDKSVELTEANLLKWSEQPDTMVRNLVHYIIDLRWTFHRALSYEEQLVTGDTSLDKLILLARARGGRVALHLYDFKITVEPA